MWARAAIAFLISTAPAVAQQDPVGRWLAGSPRADLRWVTIASPAALSRFERLSVRFNIRVNGGEIDRRRGKGVLLLIVQLRDSTGKKYESHHVMDLREAPYTAPTHLEYSEWSVPAFLTPGDYQATFALADVTTGDHNLATQPVHVSPLSRDPLPDSWRDVPTVEFVESVEPPDVWFLPEAKARLTLPVVAKRPVRLDVVVNTAASETSRNAQRRPQQNVGSLMAALKVLSQFNVAGVGPNLAVFDISRRRTIFTQDAVTEVDWPRLKSGLDTKNLSTIDVGELKYHDQEVQFFLGQIATRIAAPADDPRLRVVIVLSPPMSFQPTVDRTPIAAPAGSAYRVFYLCYQTYYGRPSYSEPNSPRFSGRLSSLEIDRSSRGVVTYSGLPDQLAQTLKPLHPHVFNIFLRRVISATQSHADILREISTAD